MNNNNIILKSVDPETDLEWMLQSEQVSDDTLIRVLVHDYYTSIYRLAEFLLREEHVFGTASSTELHTAVREIAEQALMKVVMERHRYWGEPELAAWILGITIKSIRSAGNTLQASQSSYPVFPIEQAERKNKPVDPELEKAVAALDKRSRLLLLLRYGYKLSLSGVTHVLRANQKTILTDLQAARETIQQSLDSNIPPSVKIAPQVIHRSIHRRLHMDIDGCLTPEEGVSIKLHLEDCPACQSYAANLDRFEKRLAAFLQTYWPEPELGGKEESDVVRDNILRLENGGFRRKVSIRAKETSIIGLVILVVVAVGWAIKIMAPNADSSTPVANTVKANMIQSYAAQAKPSIPETGALPTEDPGNLLPWYNSNANLPRKRFIDLNRTVMITDPVTDTIDIRQSAFNSLEVMMRYWESVGTESDKLSYHGQGVVMTPFEIVRFINSNTNLKAASRVGGDLSVLKQFLAAGFPVIVERGFDGGAVSGVSNWVGKFDVVNGYDDTQQNLTILSSYQVPGVYADLYYGSFIQQWRAFNYEYVVIYKPGQEEMVNQILGPQADTVENYHQAAEKASIDAYNSIYIRDQFFAWFNRGANLTYLRDYKDAVTTFDQAFVLYKKIPQAELPWRIFWYQTDFYQAYYGMGRYQDVIDLATMILTGPGVPQSEDSYYWRSLAEEAIRRKSSSILEPYVSLQINSDY
jgi:DNA-directed RNA polymerase specialized sigma24 family protein